MVLAAFEQGAEIETLVTVPEQLEDARERHDWHVLFAGVFYADRRSERYCNGWLTGKTRRESAPLFGSAGRAPPADA